MVTDSKEKVVPINTICSWALAITKGDPDKFLKVDIAVSETKCTKCKLRNSLSPKVYQLVCPTNLIQLLEEIFV